MIDKFVDVTVEAQLVTSCLLCGKDIPVFYASSAPKICEDCKTLWKKIKEKDNEQREAD